MTVIKIHFDSLCYEKNQTQCCRLLGWTEWVINNFKLRVFHALQSQSKGSFPAWDVASTSTEFLQESIEWSFLPTPISEPLWAVLLQKYFAKLDYCSHFHKCRIEGSSRWSFINRELNLLCKPQIRLPGCKQPSSLDITGPNHSQMSSLHILPSSPSFQVGKLIPFTSTMQF